MMKSLSHMQQTNFISCFSLCIILMFAAILIQAQEIATLRVLRAISFTDGTIVLDIELGDGKMINSAELVLPNSGQVDLELDNEIPVDNWLILDAGAGAVDVGRAFQSAIEPLSEIDTSTHSLNLIISGQEIAFLAISNRVDFLNRLDTYNPNIQQENCIVETFDVLPNDEQTKRARRVLLLVGETNESCGASVNYSRPIDIIQVANNANPNLEAFAKRNGALYISSNVASLAAQISEMQSVWQRPVYRLNGNSGQALSSAAISITLTNGEIISINVEFEQIFVEPTASPTETETPVVTATESHTATVIAALTSNPIPTVEIVTSELTAELLVANSNATETAVAAQVVPTADSGEAVAPSRVNTILLLIGGVAAIVVVIAGMFILLASHRRHSDLDLTDPYVEPVSQPNVLESTQLLQDESESPFDKTEMVSEEAITASARMTLIGHLYHDDSGTSYDIYAPSTILGRKAGVGIYIEGDRQISREHVRFSQSPDKSIWVTRLTNNPVLVNEVKFEKSTQLKTGDVLQLSTKLRLRFQEAKKDE